MEIHSRLDPDELADQFVASALVHMYSACGDSQNASLVFQEMVSPDLAVWNSMIKAYVQAGDASRALDLFSRIEQRGEIKLDGRTFVAALNACAGIAEKAGNSGSRGHVLETGRKIHERAARSRLDVEDVFVASSLIDMYAKCGSMDEARRAFDRARSRDVALWTAMIMAYARVGEGRSALELFESMKGGGIRPNGRAFVAALAACSSSLSAASEMEEEGDQSFEFDRREVILEQGRSIHREVVELGLDEDRYVSSSLVDFYSKCGSMIDARRVFDRIPSERRDLVLWTSLILGYAQSGQAEIALGFFESMQRTSLRPNGRVIVAALAACSSFATEAARDDHGRESKLSSLLRRGMDLHAQAARTNDLSDVFVASSLLDFYSKCGGGTMDRAQRLFDQMPSHDVVSFTAMISGYARSKDPEVSLHFLSRMKRDGLPPNASSYAATIKACAKMTALEAGQKIYADARRAGFGHHSAVACAAIDLYGKCGSMEQAQQLFDSVTRIPCNSKDPVIWSSLISGYSHHGDAKAVFGFFEAMKKARIRPDSITFLSVLAACNHAGMIDRGKEVFVEMSSVENGLKPGMEHYGCLVDMLGRAHRLDEAFALVERMLEKPSVGIWMALLDASRKWGDLRVGRAAFEAIKEIDVTNNASYVLMAEALIGA